MCTTASIAATLLTSTAATRLDKYSGQCYTTHIVDKQLEHNMKQIKMNRFVRMRKIMAEYGFKLSVVMCGKVENGRFYLTNRTK